MSDASGQTSLAVDPGRRHIGPPVEQLVLADAGEIAITIVSPSVEACMGTKGHGETSFFEAVTRHSNVENDV